MNETKPDFKAIARILNEHRVDSDGHKEYELEFTLDDRMLLLTQTYALYPVRKLCKISINEKRMSVLSANASAFLIAHEFAHVTLEHGDPRNKTALTKRLRHMHEYHADSEAINLCKRAGFRIEKRHLDELDQFPEFNLPDVFTHPKWEDRKGALVNDFKL